ncbi:O-acyltransferase WSD1-like [Papaver somniferum]|uniref:O-acyltransferase WSD1-like n=1 Tax=Papaver somniferum TaxID=3469 RepID=UPI000E704F45|nr:O-acyltransferase WSD1-like [Papaver somniferum]
MDNLYLDEGTSPPVSPISQSLNSSILSLYIFAVFELETPITEFEVQEICHKHILPLNIRFSSIMERNKKGVLRWKKVVTRVEDHLIVPAFPKGLARESYDEYLREYLSKIGCEKFSEDKPLWEIHLVKYPSLKGACTMIFKASHAIGDGYSLVRLFFKSCQRADHPSLPLTFPKLSLKKQDNSKRSVIGMGKIMLGFMGKCVNTTYDVVESTLRVTCLEDRPSAIRSESSNLEIELFKPFNIYSVTLSLERVKQVKTKLGATVNDVITGLLSYIIHLYALRKTGMDQYSKDGSTTDTNSGGANTNMTLAVMLNMRVFEGFTNIEDMIRAERWGNRSRFIFVNLPSFTNHEKVSPLDFIIKAKETMDKKKNSMMFYFIDKLLNTALWIWGQKGMEELIYSSFKNASTMISGVIGPKDKMTLYNHPINSFYFFTSGIPQSVAFFSVSYMEQLKLVVTMEKGFIDSKLFSSCVDEAFDDIFQAGIEI